jgi:hypothetical protein
VGGKKRQDRYSVCCVDGMEIKREGVLSSEFWVLSAFLCKLGWVVGEVESESKEA